MFNIYHFPEKLNKRIKTIKVILGGNMKHWFVFLSNNCVCDYWAKSKKKVIKHFRKNTVLKVIQIY